MIAHLVVNHGEWARKCILQDAECFEEVGRGSQADGMLLFFWITAAGVHRMSPKIYRDVLALFEQGQAPTDDTALETMRATPPDAMGTPPR